MLYPNPANGNTTVRFTLASSAHVSLTVRDIKGSVVKEIPVSELKPGEHSIPVYLGEEMAKGMYFAELKMNDLKLVKKLIVR
jgi:hypothetical protein